MQASLLIYIETDFITLRLKSEGRKINYGLISHVL